MRAIRAGVCLLAGFAVLAHGAMEAWSEAILEIGAAALFLLWGVVVVRQPGIALRWNWLFLPALGLGGFALAQSAFALSVYPYATKLALLKGGAYLLLAFLAVQAFQTMDHIRRFVWFLLGLGFFVSLLGIVQHLTFNGKLYWVRVLRQGGTPFGPFVNHHHFAGFVELIVPFGLALLFGLAVRQDKRLLLALFTVLPIGALVLTTSRGGIASFLFQIVLLGFLTRTSGPRAKRPPAAARFALVACILVIWLGVDPALRRFESSSPGEVSRDRRATMFKDTWQIFLDHPWTGTGLGTFQSVYPRYESYYDGRVVEHAHNDYLELLADTGLIGGACGLAFVVLLFRRAWFNLRSAKTPFGGSFYSGAIVACAGLMVHSLVDFNLHIPSNALLFSLIAFLGVAFAEEPGQVTLNLVQP